MVVKFVKQMNHSGNFDKTDLTNWDQRATADKTYANAKTYIQEKYNISKSDSKEHGLSQKRWKK